MTPCVREDCPGGGVLDDEGLCTVCDRPPAGTAPSIGTFAVSAADRPEPGAVPVWADQPWGAGEGGGGGESGGGGEREGEVPHGGLRSTRTTSASVGSRLGAGLVPVPPVPRRDPATIVLERAEVPESQRLCGNPACRAEVGRSSGASAGRLKGFCPRCRTPFSFTPTLSAGDMVGQYQVRGPIAHGGQGWIYLAHDVNLDGDPVVLKGLLQAGDPESYDAFVTERRFLIEVKHPAIVQIRNFVRVGDQDVRSSAGYIVMEYVDGQSLRHLLQERREEGAAGIPVPQAIAYVLEILSAFSYLHGAGLLFCDLKPDNVMLVEDRLKLIDLGAVRRIDDRASAVWASPGYAAPEIVSGSAHPSVGTDLYTVGRTLAVLTVPAAGAGLPAPGDSAVLSEYEAYYRFLLRATHPDPRARFADAGEMAEQLTGVLRQILAADGGAPTPTPSTMFSPGRTVAGTDVHTPPGAAAAALALPTPRDDPGDPAVGLLAAAEATEAAQAVEPEQAVSRLAALPVASPAVALRLIRAQLAIGDLGAARTALDNLDRPRESTHDDTATASTQSWQTVWCRGLVALAHHQVAEAGRDFLDILAMAPGELAPQLALAACAELAGRARLARHYYETVWRTDPSQVGAAFGIARTLLADATQAPRERRSRAAAVLESVPDTLHHHVPAWTEALRLRLDRADLTGPGLLRAGDRLRHIPLDEPDRTRLRSELLSAAYDWLDNGAPDPAPAPAPTIDGVALDRRALRRALADCYLTLARHALDRRQRAALVERAGRVRPTTLF
jgi:serine/threonine-protein kinase PknG